MLSGGLVFASFAEGDPHAGAVREALRASRALELSTTTLRAWRSYSQLWQALCWYVCRNGIKRYIHEYVECGLRRGLLVLSARCLLGAACPPARGVRLINEIRPPRDVTFGHADHAPDRKSTVAPPGGKASGSTRGSCSARPCG